MVLTPGDIVGLADTPNRLRVGAGNFWGRNGAEGKRQNGGGRLKQRKVHGVKGRGVYNRGVRILRGLATNGG